ncbi:MAG: glycine C-acetyltransferase, partial [Saprospiraceae bacterium]|nr:glycine C-acetyltransferase [Saprospiraceae bacterium]
MNKSDIFKEIASELDTLKQQGLFKSERIITTPQSAHIRTDAAGDVLNFCANNYLGLSSHPDVIQAAIEG